VVHMAGGAFILTNYVLNAEHGWRFLVEHNSDG
jgi:hypothetical protein